MMEEALTFNSDGSQLVAINHPANKPCSDIAVLVVVGGPQTRVGSHRQFVLLSRFLAKHGVSTMRFDYQGMGDSEGLQADYLKASVDIAAAVSACKKTLNAKRIIIWGLCDAASAALIYACQHHDQQVVGMVLLNPWVRSTSGQAKTAIKHYYWKRLQEVEFWHKLATFKFAWRASVRQLWFSINAALRGSVSSSDTLGKAVSQSNYIEYMRMGLQRFDGKVMLITSNEDLTASEFWELLETLPEWKRTVNERVSQILKVDHADHTFSNENWRGIVEQATLNWIKAL